MVLNPFSTQRAFEERREGKCIKKLWFQWTVPNLPSVFFLMWKL
jgi:hypothetical protein